MRHTRYAMLTGAKRGHPGSRVPLYAGRRGQRNISGGIVFSPGSRGQAHHHAQRYREHSGTHLNPLAVQQTKFTPRSGSSCS